MRKVALLLAIVVAAASPSLAFAGKAKRHHQTVAAQPADPNANTGHLFHDMIWGKK